MGERNHKRRDVLKATGGVLGGLAIGGVAATPVSAQSTYFRYDRLRVRLVDVESAPPRFLTAESPLYLTQALLKKCDADHSCSIDVLDYRRGGDDDDTDDAGDDDADDNGDDVDDNGDDDDGSCPGFASVVLLCHADDESDAVVLTGLIRDVLSEYSDQGADFVVSLEPTSVTNVDNPRSVSNPCPGDDFDDDDDNDDDNDDDADDNENDDNGDDDNGDG